MRSNARFVLPMLLAALALVPGPAAAHVLHHANSKGLSVGPWAAYFEVLPDPIFANSTGNVSVGVALAGSDGLTPRDAQVEVAIHGMGGESSNLTMRREGAVFVGQYRFTLPGTYGATIGVRDNSSRHENETALRVFHDLEFRIRPNDLFLEPRRGERTVLELAVVDRGGAPYDGLDDLSVRIDHRDGQGEFVDAEEHKASRVGAGLWSFEHTFAEAGIHDLRLSSQSGAFGPDDVPTYYYVFYGGPVTPSPTKTPVPGWMGLLSIVGASALVRRP